MIGGLTYQESVLHEHAPFLANDPRQVLLRAHVTPIQPGTFYYFSNYSPSDSSEILHSRGHCFLHVFIPLKPQVPGARPLGFAHFLPPMPLTLDLIIN